MRTVVPDRRWLAALVAGAVLTSLITVYVGSPALAATVTPTLIEETANQTCTDLLGPGFTELKQDPPGNGELGDGTLVVEISNFDGKQFDWSSNIGVDAVFVKAGNGGSYLYEYDPESTGDTQLTSPGTTGNEISHISFCYDVDGPVDPVDVSISPTLSCGITWSGNAFAMKATVDFQVSVDEGVESITITPGPGGDESIAGATWTGSAVDLQPWLYTWEANMASGYEGLPPSGEFDFDSDWFSSECSCPDGSIDLSNTGSLAANNTRPNSLAGEPASPVDIPAGFFEIYLASFDDHSHRPDQIQRDEVWALADSGDGSGSFESPPTGDLPNDLNFQSYHVTASTGPVFVPEFAGDDLWTHHAAYFDPNINSVFPACAQLVQDVRNVDVVVSATACQIDQQGNPVGNIEVSVDPDAQATVDVYTDSTKSTLVASLSSSGSIDGLAPGDYYWEATPAIGYTLTGATSGTITIEDCTPPPPPSGWACVAGEVAFIEDATNFQGTLYPTEQAAAGAPGCAEVDAASTFTIDGSCEVVAGTAGFAISGDLGEGLSLAVGGQVADEPGPFSIGVGAAGDYDYSVTVADGFVLADGSPAAEGTISVGDCTDQVLALVLVTVVGSCDLDGDDGVGVIDVTMSVAGGADVIVRNSSGSVVGTLSDDGALEVPAGASYTWEATPNEGFEFAVDFDPTGSTTIETCANPETLPFTGLDADVLAAISALLLGSGLLLLVSQKGRHEE